MPRNRFRLSQIILVAGLVCGYATSTRAGIVVMTDPVTFATPVYVGSTDLSYTHDIVPDGYDVRTDSIIDAVLSVHLTDDALDLDWLGFGTVMFDFDGTDEEEVSVKEGQRVTVLRDVGEWLYVLNQAQSKAGYVPATYVEWEGDPGVEYERFQVSLNGMAQGVYPVTGGWFSFAVPAAYLGDGSLAVNIHSDHGDFDFQDAYLTVTVDRIPEPATMLLLGAGLAGLMLRRWKQA